jgi:pyruvate dehydrogenase E2 component (dihydrolipoamide acetyltransferase)
VSAVSEASGAVQAITMPKWGLAMDEGKVVAWHLEEGQAVAAGDEVVEIETTKITNVFESPVAGTLRRRVAAEGETVPVGALLAVVAEAAVAEAEIEAFVEDFQASFEVAAAAEAEAAPEPEVVEAGGRRLRILRSGTGEGPAIVLLHGFGGDLNNWLFNQPMLSESHEVIALDLPGHGGSGKDVGAGDMAMLSAALGDLLDALGLERVHLVGHSMGGALALAFALKRPRAAASLTLIAPGGLGPEINMDYIEGFIGAGRRKEMKGVLELLVADPGLISRDMVNEVLKYKRLDGVEAALGTLAGALFPGGRQETFGPAHLAALKAPTQAIWGRRDRIVPAAHAEALPPGVAVHLLDDVGHMPHMEAAAEVNRLIAGMAGGG